MDILNHVFVRGRANFTKEIQLTLTKMGAKNTDLEKFYFNDPHMIYYLEEGFVNRVSLDANPQLYKHIVENWDERIIDGLLSRLYLARDRNGDLNAFLEKPKRLSNAFDANLETGSSIAYWAMPSELFPEVTWENSPKKLEYKLLDE